MEIILKKIFILLLCLLFGTRLYSQVDSSTESFFPFAIGNSWHYQSTQTQGYTTTLTRDSVANGSRFLFFDSSNVPAYEIDSMLNVWGVPTTGYRRLEYKLTAQKNELWHVVGGIVAKIDTIYWDYILGTLTQVKKIGYYSAHDTINFSIWFYDYYLAAGLGYYLSIGDAMQTPLEELYGCIINGKTYGKMTSVKDHDKNNTLLSYILYPSFPNPFNPSTTMRYSISKTSSVKLTVYDLSGRAVATLVNEEKPAGTYTVSWNAAHLSSGVYFSKLTAGKFSQVKKMMHLK
jgi:hypothetical protein